MPSFPPHLPIDTAWSMTLVHWFMDVLQAPLLWLAIRLLAKSHRSPNLLSHHMLHRMSTGRVCHGVPSIGHFGSINSLSHASSMFSSMTHLTVDYRARAKAGWDFNEMKLVEMAHILKVGKVRFRLHQQNWTCEIWDCRRHSTTSTLIEV